MKKTINAIIVSAGIAVSATVAADDFSTAVERNADAVVNYNINTDISGSDSVVDERSLKRGILNAKVQNQSKS
ncbi:MAG: hypothetical protein RIB78_11405 [Gammaproteobacteria bacterium]